MNKRHLFVVLLALAVIVSGGFVLRGFFLRLGGDGGKTALESLQPGVDVELTGIRFSETRQGVRKYQLSADSATYSAHGISSMNHIEVIFFDTNGHETMRLRADEGELSGTNQSVNLRGDVVLKGTQGFVLKTDHLSYSKEDDRLQTNETVLLESAQGVLRGRGLIVAPEKGRLQLLHDVSGEIGGGLIELKSRHGH